MLKIKRFVNELMTSNCYVDYDEDTMKCIAIDPASKKSEREIAFISDNKLSLDYIIITHEHTDHNWGVNALREKYPQSKLICSDECSKQVKKANRAYFLLYYDNPNYRYEIAPADILVTCDDVKQWDAHKINFVMTPGHSKGSMCVDIDRVLFTGDTIMPYKPYFNGRDSNQDDWKQSVEKIARLYSLDTVIYPGHGDILTLGEWIDKKY